MYLVYRNICCFVERKIIRLNLSDIKQMFRQTFQKIQSLAVNSSLELLLKLTNIRIQSLPINLNLCRLANQHHIVVVQPHLQPKFDAVFLVIGQGLAAGDERHYLFDLAFFARAD